MQVRKTNLEESYSGTTVGILCVKVSRGHFVNRSYKNKIAVGDENVYGSVKA